MKVLIYYDKNYLSPSGGPAGYLYNLNKELERRNINNISFLNNRNIYLRKKIKGLMMKVPLLNSYAKYISKKNNDNLCLTIAKRVENANNNACNNKFEKFDVIHFHSTSDMYCEKNNLENYKGIVLLTSHSPEPFYQELIKTCPSNDYYMKNKDVFDNVENADIYAFTRADFVLFPCQYAEEPYFHTWQKYPSIRNSEKIKYIPTGILPVKAYLTREDICKKYGIPKDSFIISFVGRHNEIKGYDILKKLAQYLEHDKDIYFICCGKEGPLYKPNLSNWIEVGWTNDPYSIVKASNLYILPNRETYFDIAILQTLSLGKISLVSDTGGNKYFKNNEHNGIYVYDDFESLIKNINKIRNLDDDDIKCREKNQIEYFYQNFTIEKFCDKYLEILNECMGECL